MSCQEPRSSRCDGRGPRRHGPQSQRGASAVEYGLLIAGIAALIVVAIFLFGSAPNSLFNGACSEIYVNQSNGDCD